MLRHTIVMLVAVPALLHSQARDTARIAPVVTTATRVPVSLNLLPASVTVISAADLRLRGIVTVADALNSLPSAYLAQTGSQGGTTSLFLRGGESKHVKVLIDGVAVNDPGGLYDFASLTTDNIERIEIVRGPVSVIHGADAVTGVVQIFTRRGEGPQRVETSVQSGFAARDSVAGQPSPRPLHTWDMSTSLSGGLPTGSYSVALARHASDGLYELNNHYRNDVLSGRFAFAPQDGMEVRVSLRYTDYRYNYPTTSAGDIADSNAFRDEDRTSIGVEVERALSTSVRTVLALSSSVNDGGTDDGPDGAGNSSVSQDKVRRRGLEWRLQLQPAAHTTATLSAQLEQQDQRSQLQSESPFGPYNSLFSASRRNLGFAGEALFAPGDRVTATVGVRLDDNERFGNFTTARAGMSVRALPHTRLRATVGSAFREPSFFENYAAGLGNPGLEPEETRSAEVAVEQDIADKRATVSVVAFAQRFSNMIDYSPGNVCGYSYCNVTEVDANGLEVEGRATLWGPLSAKLGGTLLQTEVLTPGYDTTSGGQYHKGDALIRRPAAKWTGDLEWRDSGPLSGAVRVLVVGPRGDRDFHFYPSTPLTLASYQRVDVGAAYELRAARARHTTLTLRVENLLNEHYESVFNYLAPRRTVNVGVRASF